MHRGTAFDKRTGKKLRGPWTPSLAAARGWRTDAMAAIRAGTLSGDRGPKLGAATEEFLAGVESLEIRNRNGRPFKPSAYRGLRTALNRLVEHFGKGTYLADLELDRLQRFVDERSRGAAASTVANDINALRSLYGWARRRNRALHDRDPFKGLLLPTGETARDRIAAPKEMGLLVAALEPSDRALLAIAAWAGCRRGEGLAFARGPSEDPDDPRSYVDLEAGVLCVRWAWDPGSHQFIAPKTKHAVRDIPIVAHLRVILEDHLEAMPDQRPEALLFPGRRGPDAHLRPMSEGAFIKRARSRWQAINERTLAAAKEEGREPDPHDFLRPIGLHDARHTYASVSIAAGVNAKALSTYMGHSSIQITYDRYGHLMPGNEDEARELVDAYMTKELA
jgi:integrase